MSTLIEIESRIGKDGTQYFPSITYHLKNLREMNHETYKSLTVILKEIEDELRRIRTCDVD